MSLSPKDPSEIVTLSFDFAALTATPSNPLCTLSVINGPDPDVATMKIGAATLSGTKALQQIGAGVDGKDYTVRWEVDAPDGDHFVEAQKLMVRIAK